MKSLTYVLIGVVVIILGSIFFSSGFDPAADQPTTFTIAGAVIMLGLVLFFQGIYRRGQESKPKQTS
ncbi:MAG: hypothetical protein LYZ69_07015 [Nitrososphaerales archaeon]|nr:hypothetical protein [Nitrososphaerales archaeon]